MRRAVPPVAAGAEGMPGWAVRAVRKAIKFSRVRRDLPTHNEWAEPEEGGGDSWLPISTGVWTPVGTDTVMAAFVGPQPNTGPSFGPTGGNRYYTAWSSATYAP